jgi:hypothetical protein
MPIGPKNWGNKSNGKSGSYLLTITNQTLYNIIFSKSNLIFWLALILGVCFMTFSAIVPYFFKDFA